jgi:FAD/FMN-containing dehydrogenase
MALAGLTDAVRGRVVTKGDVDYDDARAVFNAMMDKRPEAVAYCADEEDVVSAIAYGRREGLRIAVRGGGHNAGGAGRRPTTVS